MSLLRKVNATIKSSNGTENFIFPFGEQLAGKKHDDVSCQFQYNYLDYKFDVKPETVTGDGVAGSSNSTCFVSSATTGTSLLRSRNTIRYRPGHSGFIDFTLKVIGAGIGKGGGFDAGQQDGFQLKISNDVASFGYLESGTEKGTNGAAGFDAQADWNGNLDPSEVDWEKMNIFRITYGFLGVASPTLWIKLGEWYHLHTVETEGVLEYTHVDSPVFPIAVYAENDCIAVSGSWNGGTIANGSKAGSRGFSFPSETLVDGTTRHQGSLTLTGTTVGTIVIFHAKETFKGVENHVKVRLLSYDFEVDIPSGNNFGKVIFQLIAGPTLSGTPTYVDLDDSSVMEIDYDITNSGGNGGASVDASGGRVILEKVIEYTGSSKGGSTGSVNVNAEDLGAFAYGGDTFAYIAKDEDGNGVNVRMATNREELF